MLRFTDWFPTLINTTTLNIPTDRTIDGRDVMLLLRGKTTNIATQHFQQCNQYTSLVTVKAANRDRSWKLLRPEITKGFAVQPENSEQDRDVKYESETHTELSPLPEPKRLVPAPSPMPLFNIDDDPVEQNNLVEAKPERLSQMLANVET